MWNLFKEKRISSSINALNENEARIYDLKKKKKIKPITFGYGNIGIVILKSFLHTCTHRNTHICLSLSLYLFFYGPFF